MPDSSQAAAAASAVQRPGFSSNARMRLLVYGLCFLTLLFLPIKMGATHGDKGPNYALPVIGYIESACIKQSSKTFKNATLSYAVAQTVSKTVDVLQNIQVSVGLASMSPGKILGSLSEGLDRISDGLFWVMSAMLVWRFFIGIFFWLCLKILLPGALLFAMYNLIRPSISAALLAGFFSRITLALLIFLPAIAIINSRIEAAFETTVIQKVEEIEKDQVFQDNGSASVGKDNSGFLGGIYKSASNLAGKLNPEQYWNLADRLFHKSKDILDNLQNALAAFVLTAFIVPIIFLFILWKIIVGIAQSSRRRLGAARLFLNSSQERPAPINS